MLPLEAARAGDAGRGFAVVADQIRTLAEQSAKSAVDSRNLIEASIYEVGEGNKIATKASDSLKEVVDGVQSIAESAKKMRDVSTSQAAGMEQADVAIARMQKLYRLIQQHHRRHQLQVKSLQHRLQLLVRWLHSLS